jgi:hypothetical protein
MVGFTFLTDFSDAPHFYSVWDYLSDAWNNMIPSILKETISFLKKKKERQFRLWIMRERWHTIHTNAAMVQPFGLLWYENNSYSFRYFIKFLARFNLFLQLDLLVLILNILNRQLYVKKTKISSASWRNGACIMMASHYQNINIIYLCY